MALMRVGGPLSTGHLRSAGQALRRGVLFVCLWIGVSTGLATAATPGISVPILMYHHIEDGFASPYAVSRADFEAQLAYLQASGYTTITLDQFLANHSSGAPLPPKPVIVTCDDGYRSAYTAAKPLLEQYGFRGTFFLITDYVADTEAGRLGYPPPGDLTPPDPFLIWPEVVALAQAGHDLESHTCTHPYLTLVDVPQLTHELVASRAVISTELGRPADVLAYPYGDTDAVVASATASAGYAGAVLASGGIENTATANPYGLQRIAVTGGESLASFVASMTVPTPPAPHITSVTPSRNRVALGQTVDLAVTAINSGGDSGLGGISVSFPSLTSASDGSLVTPVGLAWGDFALAPSGSDLWNRQGSRFSSQYLLAERSTEVWLSQASHTFTLRVQPKALGTFTMYARSWMVDLTGGPVALDPADSPVQDQQGYPVTACSVTVGTNSPPVAEAGPDRVVEADSPSGARVTLNGSGSTDADSIPGTNDDIVSFRWYENGQLVAAGATPTVVLKLGTHRLELDVVDSTGAGASDAVTITVRDTTPPQLSVSVSPSTLWPPNNKLVQVMPTVASSDVASPPASVRLVSITCSEAGQVTTYVPTWNWNPSSKDAGTSAVQTTADGRLYLRAQRAGNSSGRTYTLTYQATDASGLSTRKQVVVTVPHDQG